MRIRNFTLLLAAALAAYTPPAQAQRALQLGVRSPSSAESVIRKGISHRSDPTDSWQRNDFWKWTDIGIVVGGIAGAIWAGVQVSRSDDPMFGNYAVAVGAGGGAIIGGLVAAFSYTISHSPHQSP